MLSFHSGSGLESLSGVTVAKAELRVRVFRD